MKKITKSFLIVFIITFILILTPFAWIEITKGDVDQETKFVAHRGLSSEYYENTKEAFIAAGESDFFYAIETDIWLTSDGIWVCAHDANPFENENLHIGDIAYETAMITPLKMNISADIELNGDYFLCDFETYLDICIQYEKIAFIEVKDAPTLAEVQSLIDLIESKISRDKYTIISFNKENIEKINSINSDISTQILSSHISIGVLNLYKGYNIGIKDKPMTKYFVYMAQKRGKQVNVWTINDKDLALKYMSYGVEFITTDYILEVNQNG